MGQRLLHIGKKKFSELISEGLQLPVGTKIEGVHWEIERPSMLILLLEHPDFSDTPEEQPLLSIGSENGEWLV